MNDMSPLPRPEALCLATNNSHKLAELRAVFAPLLPGIRLLSLDEVGGPFTEVDETGTTFEENAILKARGYAELTGLPTLADDSGLCVGCLDGAPGVRSARYAPTTPERIERVLDEVHAAVRRGATSRHAWFDCAMAMVDPAAPDDPVVAHGRVDGEIIGPPRGSGGFGYDPIFHLPDLGLRMAELTESQKHELSHRGRAARALSALLIARWETAAESVETA